MLVLLDTHVVIWALTNDPRLTPQARDLIAKAGTRYFSPANVWEIAIKGPARIGLGGISLPVLVDTLKNAGYSEAPITAQDAAAIASLPTIHADPFDRMLYAQARHLGARLLTVDGKLLQYGPPCLDVR